MKREAVSDTGPVRHLWEIEQQRILTLFSTVYLPNQVKEELSLQDVWENLEQTILDRFRVEEVAESEIQQMSVRFAETALQSADLAVIVLAKSVNPSAVLTDDLDLRKTLESLGLTVVGSVGLLIRAFKNGNFGKPELEVLIDGLFTGSTLYLSQAFKQRVRKLIEELSEGS
jgi:predicted nucleic acid-binding protein